MNIILDANILFSALIKPAGTIGLIIFSNSDLNLIAPEFIQIEFFTHAKKLAKITHKTEEEIISDYEKVAARITFYSEGILPNFILEKAKQLVADIDPKDASYVAFALFFNTKIWSGDKVLAEGLKAKGYDLTLTTQDVVIAIMK